MSKKQSFTSHYKDPFQSPRANSKKSFHQVNGETEQSQHNIILEKQMRTRT
ncbi:YpzG family protein [Alkalicoccobacillus porphyridii]|uniref:YpzG family protein n=1 Tax=Alkalicoccobacillus porphyridii TaxID=2597270 RepID=A0A553ZUM4_9BACI|nr:YpzG family protein [Alkalicoccobacillus porphyridii]TSB45198.1 YpzG family protein [Alkalicoccobacillus porphyridii]